MGRSGTGRETLGEIRDGLGDDQGGPEQVGDSWVGPERVGDPRRRCEMGRETLVEVWDGSGDP